MTVSPTATQVPIRLTAESRSSQGSLTTTAVRSGSTPLHTQASSYWLFFILRPLHLGSSSSIRCVRFWSHLQVQARDADPLAAQDLTLLGSDLTAFCCEEGSTFEEALANNAPPDSCEYDCAHSWYRFAEGCSQFLVRRHPAFVPFSALCVKDPQISIQDAVFSGLFLRSIEFCTEYCGLLGSSEHDGSCDDGLRGRRRD